MRFKSGIGELVELGFSGAGLLVTGSTVELLDVLLGFSDAGVLVTGSTIELFDVFLEAGFDSGALGLLTFFSGSGGATGLAGSGWGGGAGSGTF